MIQLGIIGYPLEHTLSPLLHHTVMQRMGLVGEYAVMETRLLANTLNQLMLREITGFNVTIPYKVEILNYCDQLTDMARVLQAVNTVKRVGDQWHGTNTDATGYLSSLPVRDTINQRRCTVLGTGGAARAIVAALIMEQADTLTLVGRNPETLAGLLQLAQAWLAHFNSPTQLVAMPWAQLQTLQQTDLLVNTTPVGTLEPNVCPIDVDLLHTLPLDAFVSDLVYRPLETCLVAESRAAGYEADGGLGMLVHQGIQAFQWWTGKPVPQPVINAVFQRLTIALSEPTAHV